MGLISPISNTLPIEVRDNPITISFEQVDLRDALKKLFKVVNVSYSVEPSLQGKISVDLKGVPFDKALQRVLDQVKGTFTVEAGIYMIVSTDLKSSDEFLGITRVVLPDFQPGHYSESYVIQNKALYLPSQRTMGSTYDLLAETVRVAGYPTKTLYSYGKDGFAFVLPVELIRKDGQPVADRRDHSHLGNGWIYQGQVANQWQPLSSPANSSFRAIVLIITPSSIRPDGPVISANWNLPVLDATLPESVRLQKWTTDPTLTVLIYEYKAEGGNAKTRSLKAILLKPRESKISAKEHILGSRLWTSKQLK
jgi:hypothetical protein